MTEEVDRTDATESPHLKNEEETQTTEMNQMFEEQQRPSCYSRLSNVPVIGNIINAFSSYSTLILYRKEFRWIWLGGVVRYLKKNYN